MKRILLLTVNIFLVTQSYSQLYVKLKPSFNKSLGGQVMTNVSSVEYTPGLQEITESIGNVRSSLGQGFMSNLTLGYSFTTQFSAELGFSHLNGKSTEGRYTVKYTNSEEVSKYTLTGNLFSIDPTFVFSSREKEFFRTYVSLGFPINFISFDEHYLGTESGSTRSEERTVTYTGAIKVGVSTKFGIIAKLSESFELFGEMGFTYINFSPNESETTQYEVGGKDAMSSLNISELKSIYKENTVKDYTYDYTLGSWVESYSPNSPRTRKKFDIPVSYLSFSLGLKVNLFKKEYAGR
jgi:hypothetical protein